MDQSKNLGRSVSDRDIWMSAAELIKAHGDSAWEQAVVRYFELKKEGDEAGMAVYRRIVRAIDDFTAVRPGESEN